MAPIPTDDFLDDARKRMVDSQLRPNKIVDPRILAAMRRFAAEAFLPAALVSLAYSDQNIALAPGRVVLQPMVLARLVQSAVPMSGERVLVVGAGGGYTAALFAALGCAVTALEEAGPLADLATASLAKADPAIDVVTGPLTAGWAAGAPYDIVLIDGAVPEIPAVLAGQLNRQTGRLLTIVNTDGRTSHAVRAEPTLAGVSTRAMFDCLCPVMPAFARVPVFEF